jgi:hypothetical protein
MAFIFRALTLTFSGRKRPRLDDDREGLDDEQQQQPKRPILATTTTISERHQFVWEIKDFRDIFRLIPARDRKLYQALGPRIEFESGSEVLQNFNSSEILLIV